MNYYFSFFIASFLLFISSCSGSGNSSGSQTSEVAAPEDTVSERQLPDFVTVAFTGDIMMGTTYPDSVHGSGLPPEDGKHIFDDVREIISGATFAGGNLEGSFLDGPGHRRRMTNPKTYFIFRMPPEYVNRLLEAGYDFVGIANNHITDFGEPGRQSTRTTLGTPGSRTPA